MRVRMIWVLWRCVQRLMLAQGSKDGDYRGYVHWWNSELASGRLVMGGGEVTSGQELQELCLLIRWSVALCSQIHVGPSNDPVFWS